MSVLPGMKIFNSTALVTAATLILHEIAFHAALETLKTLPHSSPYEVAFSTLCIVIIMGAVHGHGPKGGE